MGTLSRPISWESKTAIGKVMVVDPKILVRISVCRALADSGYEAMQARDGTEAVAQYQANRDAISLVIMDIGMPEAGGIEAAREIRAINPSAKIIYTDGNPELGSIDPEIDAFLSKPFTLGPFFETLQQVLKVERRQHPHRPRVDAPTRRPGETRPPDVGNIDPSARNQGH
jgi:CheY-like chemotaxis protein